MLLYQKRRVRYWRRFSVTGPFEQRNVRLNSHLLMQNKPGFRTFTSTQLKFIDLSLKAVGFAARKTDEQRKQEEALRNF